MANAIVRVVMDVLVVQVVDVENIGAPGIDRAHSRLHQHTGIASLLDLAGANQLDQLMPVLNFV